MTRSTSDRDFSGPWAYIRRVNVRVKACAALACVAVVLGATGCSASGRPGSDSRSAFSFRDDFAGPAGTSPNTQIWATDIGNAEYDGWGNRELQYYTGGADNVSLDGQGNLAITARRTPAGMYAPCWNGDTCPYTSGRVNSMGTVSLDIGHAEVRMKVPAGLGLWPAFWMLGGSPDSWPDDGEIDVAEIVGSELGIVNGTVHGPGYSDDGGITGEFDSEVDLSADFHTYAVDKSADSVSWSLDGTTYFEVRPEDLPPSATWVFDRPFYLLLNLAVGGTMPGDPDSWTPFPATLLVDYVSLDGIDASAAGTSAR